MCTLLLTSQLGFGQIPNMRTKELHQGQLLCKIPMYCHQSLLVGSVQLAILAGGQSGTDLCSHDQIWWTTQSSVHCNLPLLRLLTPPKAHNFGSCPCSLDIDIDDDLVGQLPTLPCRPPSVDNCTAPPSSGKLGQTSPRVMHRLP